MSVAIARGVRVAAALAALLALLPVPARGDDRGAADLASRAAEALDALRYDDALALLDRAWRRGESGPAQLRRIFELAGRAAGSIGDAAAARLWFSRWLCLDREAALPAGTSPKLTGLLGEARAALAGEAIAAHARRRGRSIEVTVERDPLAMVTAARAGDERAAIEAGAARLAAPARGPDRPDREDRVELLDRHGNVLAALSIDSAGERPPAPSPAAPASPDRSGWYARPLPWAVTAGALAAAGGVALVVAVDARAGVRDLNASSSQHEFTEARALERRFDRAQWTARLALGGAAIAATVGVVCYLRLRGTHASAAPADGGGVVVTWSGSLP